MLRKVFVKSALLAGVASMALWCTAKPASAELMRAAPEKTPDQIVNQGMTAEPGTSVNHRRGWGGGYYGRGWGGGYYGRGYGWGGRWGGYRGGYYGGYYPSYGYGYSYPSYGYYNASPYYYSYSPGYYYY